MFSIYRYTTFHKCASSGSLSTAVRLKAKEYFRTDAKLLLFIKMLRQTLRAS